MTPSTIGAWPQWQRAIIDEQTFVDQTGGALQGLHGIVSICRYVTVGLFDHAAVCQEKVDLYSRAP